MYPCHCLFYLPILSAQVAWASSWGSAMGPLNYTPLNHRPHTPIRLFPSQKALPPRFFTVGRLDVASHGLVLVTNDGHWAQKVIHPSAGLTKE